MVPLFLTLAACNGPRVAHSGETPEFPLEGAHALVPCAACHGTGTPKAQPTECMACHDENRPTPDHFAGQDCVGCHTVFAWNQIIGTVPPTGDTAGTTTPPTETGEPPVEHIATDETTLCATCHEIDRLAPDHYPESDCKVCHTPTAYGDSPIVHPVIVPHEAGIHVCSECHPGGDTSAFDCGTCHAAIFPHYGPAIAPGDAANAACLGCHPALTN